jgi:hypothetical protein
VLVDTGARAPRGMPLLPPGPGGPGPRVECRR